MPQRSCLSPLLFNIYLSDIPNLTYSELAFLLMLLHFSLVIKILTISKNWLQYDLLLYTIETLNGKLKLTWINVRLKSLHSVNQSPLQKYSFLNLSYTLDITQHNNAVSWLLLDTKLKWNAHIKNIIYKTSTEIYKLHSLKTLTQQINIYHSYSSYTYLCLPYLVQCLPKPILTNYKFSNINSSEKYFTRPGIFPTLNL